VKCVRSPNDEKTSRGSVAVADGVSGLARRKPDREALNPGQPRHRGDAGGGWPRACSRTVPPGSMHPPHGAGTVPTEEGVSCWL